jgi:hypothetical protein
METIRIEPPLLLEGIATGELQGRGLWQLSSDDGENDRQIRLDCSDDQAVDEPSVAHCSSVCLSGTTTWS